MRPAFDDAGPAGSAAAPAGGSAQTPPGAPRSPAFDAVPHEVRYALPWCTADLLLLVAGHGRALWCNDAFEALAPAGPAVPGRGLDELLPPPSAATRGALLDAVSRLRHGLDFAAFEVELVRGSGQPTRWLRVSSQRLGVRPAAAAPAQARVLCVMQDISAMKRQQAEALRLAELLDMAQEFGRLGVWDREPPSGAGRWDRHVHRFFGLDPAAGMPSHGALLERIHPDDRAGLLAAQAFDAPGTGSHRFRALQPDGGVRHLHSIWQVRAREADGAPDRVLGVMVDDSEAWRLARSVDEANRRFELARLALDLGGLVVWRQDLATGRVTCDDAGYAALGVLPGPDGLSAEEGRAAIHPDDLPRVQEATRRALATRRAVDVEARVRDAEGAWRHVLTRRVAEPDGQGAPAALLGIALDVTAQAEERRRAADRLRQFELSADAAGIGAWSTDEDGEHAEWNAQMYAIFGRAPHARPPSICEWLRTIVHPHDRRRAEALIEEWLKSHDAPGEFEFRLLRPDGEVRWVAARFGAIAQPQGRRLIGVVVDRTAQKRADAALGEAHERAALAARSVGIGTWEVDFETGAERWDEQMFLLRGLAPAERALTRSERLAIVHPDDIGVTVDARAPLTDAGTGATSYEFRIVRPDGQVRWLASRSIAVADAAGRPLRRIGVNWDVTQGKQAEAERREREAAERENRAKSQFMARMSHELRTPLNAVLGFTQLMQADDGASTAQRERLGLIGAAGQHLLSLIDDVLDLSNLQAGDLRLDCEPVALDALAAETLQLLAPLAARHGVTLHAEALAGQAALADRLRLRQVLINLVSNAVKYNRPQGRVVLSATQARGRVVLSVADSGRGLTEPQRAHLFEPFNRLGAERDGIEGTGIGLVIVKALVERMGGTVAVDSRPGEGTVFSIDLAAARAGAGVADAPAKPGRREAGAAAGRLLYIEDNPVNVLLVEGLVEHRPGIELHAAETGEAGVASALELQPALTLVDMHLPDIDGFEVLRRLRAHPRGAGLRCIALSANALPDDIALALAAGFADYWTKPIRFDRFLAGLDAVFGAAAEPQRPDVMASRSS